MGIGAGAMGTGTIGHPTLPVWLSTRCLGIPPNIGFMYGEAICAACLWVTVGAWLE